MTPQLIYNQSIEESDIHNLCRDLEQYSAIEPKYYERFDVKRGLRNADGSGVIAGITRICNVHGYVMNEGERQPIPGQLIYRGYDINDLIENADVVEKVEVAADVVTIVDDPLMKGGLATSAFDGEGSASRTKKVVDSGKLTTLLHDRKTARKQGVSSTGNAARVGGRIMVAPTNLYIAAGEKSLDELMADVGNGVVITELAGLHAGANPSSGDFSLLSKGYTIENGKRGRAVEQITVAGNFYQLLKSIRAVGSDLTFEGSSIGSPSVDAGTLKISG